MPNETDIPTREQTTAEYLEMKATARHEYQHLEALIKHPVFQEYPENVRQFMIDRHCMALSIAVKGF